MTESDRYVDWDAAYVLGALSPAERREFEVHLRTCPRCSAAVAELAGMPGLLAQVPEADARSLDQPEPEGPSPAVLSGVLHVARRRRRVTRWLVGALGATAAASVAILVLALTGVLGDLSGGLGGGGALRVELVAESAAPVSAEVRLIEHDWGTAVSVECRTKRAGGGPATPPATTGGSYGDGGEYGLYLTDRSGRTTMVSSWRAAAGKDVRTNGSTEVPLAQIARLDIRDMSGGDVLLSASVDG
ncbi:zf-HC2 domain-containing protein [Rathayibacter sp. YIM 133350]|uniref:zf-HC2 domain-containing protein n=1 Tax=Rathayibacter sp. YIM 133350 TaxID=3131992 RepID=UPI00307DC9EA